MVEITVKCDLGAGEPQEIQAYVYRPKLVIDPPCRVLILHDVRLRDGKTKDRIVMPWARIIYVDLPRSSEVRRAISAGKQRGVWEPGGDLEVKSVPARDPS